MLWKRMGKCAPEFRTGPRLSLRAKEPSIPQGRGGTARPPQTAATARQNHAGSGEHDGCEAEPFCAFSRHFNSLSDQAFGGGKGRRFL